MQRISRERQLLGAHRDTPPVDDILSRQVSWLAGRRCCPAFPKPHGFSDFVGQRLAAYSCGGSAGIAPASLLAPDQTKSGDHDGWHYAHEDRSVNLLSVAAILPKRLRTVLGRLQRSYSGPRENAWICGGSACECVRSTPCSRNRMG